ncbi:TetR/AcrR family transcriptional regulator [Telmatospirillum sp. J64-1]|uniref:TetR/AcrR family transcriptional regulator n=1 Tax=Telmatospirillum sp. J64-1 TaxID=2502183 RepID=UPI00163DBA4C|nr:TetR/AcrR family transcriptional regulator [Telmatospirillum sp. J64-1]
MVRTAKFQPEVFVEAAIDLIAEGGPSAATMVAIARKAGAPTGSIYHRFTSRSCVVATAWLAVHASLSTRLLPLLRAGKGMETALALTSWARESLREARFLLLNETDDLFEDTPPETLRREMQRQQEELDEAFFAFLKQEQGEEALARAKFALFDGPVALLRPHLLAGGPVPSYVDRMVMDLHQAVAA